MMNLTTEEVCLICAYGISDRSALAAAIRNSLTDLDEPEMRELAISAASKLESMTDAGFEALDRIPDFDFESEGEDGTEG